MKKPNLVVNVNKSPLSQGAQVTVPTSLIDKGFWRMVMLYQFLYSMAGLLTGLACEVMGAIMFIQGVDGGTNQWTASLFGITINNAAPGVVLFLIGLACWYFTKFEVQLSAAGDEPTPAPAPAPDVPAKN